MTTTVRPTSTPSESKALAKDAGQNIETDLPRQQLQADARKSQSITGITMLVDGKQVDFLKQRIPSEGITVEESLNKFVRQAVSKAGAEQSVVFAEKEVKGLIDRIVAAYKNNQQNAAVVDRLEKDLRVYLDNLLTQNLEESKHAKELSQETEKKQKLPDIAELSKQFETAVYNKAVAENLGYPEHEVELLSKKLAQARNALVQEAPDRADEISKLEQNTKNYALQTAQKIKQVHDQIKKGISNGWDLALLMQNLSQSEYQHLSNYFRANNSGQHIWQFTEKELWWNKEKGREAHSGACCTAAEYNAAGFSIDDKPSFVKQVLSDTKTSKEQKLEALKSKLEELSFQSAQNISESAANLTQEDLVKSVSQTKINLNKKSEEVYAAIKSLGFDTTALKEAQSKGFSLIVDETIKQHLQTLAYKKSLETSFYTDSRNEAVKAQADGRNEYWDKKLSEFKNNLRAIGYYSKENEKSFDSAIRQAESAGQARAQVLIKSLLNFNAATREWGTKEEAVIASLADSEGKLYSASEINLISQRHKAEFGTTLQEEIRDELGGKDLDRALAMFRSDDNAVFACDLRDASKKSFIFWGPDKQNFITNSSRYQSLPEEQKKLVDNELRLQGVLQNGQTFEGYCRTEFSGKTKIAAEAIFSKSKEQTRENQAVLIAIQLNKHIGFFSDDYREMGKILEPGLIVNEPGKAVGRVDGEIAKLVLKKYTELYGDNLLEDLKTDKKGAIWIRSLLNQENAAHIDAAKYAYASEKKDLELAASVFDRPMAGGQSQLQAILSIPDANLREQKLAAYQAEMRSHIQAVEAKSKELFNKNLDDFNRQVVISSQTQSGYGYPNYGYSNYSYQSNGPLNENGKILNEYRSFIFTEAKELKADNYQALQSVTKMHLAMRNKSWGADDQVVLDQIKGSSDEMLELKKAYYKKLVGKDLESDLYNQLKNRNADLAKFMLDGEPKFEGDHYAYIQAILKRAERRLQLEERGWNRAKDEINDLRSTYANMCEDSKFILENRNKALSIDEKVKYEKAVKRFFSDSEHFKIMADHHNQIQREKADFWVNTITIATVVVVGVGLSVFTGGASLGLLAIAGYTAGASLAVRIAAKGIFYGAYDFKDDLQEDAAVALRDGGLALVGGAVFKGLGALKNAVVSRLSARAVAFLDSGAQARLAAGVLNNEGSRDVLRQTASKVTTLVKEYAGSGLYNAAGNQYVSSGYAYLAKRALENPSILDALEKVAMRSVGSFNRNAIEQSLSGIKLSVLRKTIEKSMPSYIGKSSAKILLNEFDSINRSFLSALISSDPSHLRYLLAAYNATGTGAVVGVAAQAMSADTYSNNSDVGIIAKLLKAGGMGAVAGGVLGAGFAYVGQVLSGTWKLGSHVIKWDKNYQLSDVEFRKLYPQRTWFGLGGPKYDPVVLTKLHTEKAGVVFGGDLKIARDAARSASWWRPTEVWHRWRVHRVNAVLEKAQTSEELQAGYRIYDKWSKGQYASIDDFWKFRNDPFKTLAGKVTEPDTRMSRWLLEKKIWWKVRVWGNFNLTEHQIGIAQQVGQKGRMTKLDLWQFRRTSVLGQETNDAFSQRYGFFVKSSSPVQTTSYSDSSASIKVWGRGEWVRPVYRHYRKLDAVDDLVIGARRVAAPALAALVLKTATPSVIQTSSVDDFVNLQPKIEMVVKAENLTANSVTGEKVMKQMYESGQIQKAQADGALLKGIEKKVVVENSGSYVKADAAINKTGDIQKNSTLKPDIASSKVNTNKAADSVKYQVKIQHNHQDQDFDKQIVNHHDQIIQEQRMIQQQIIQQQIVREQIVKNAESTKAQQKAAKKAPVDPFILPFDFANNEEKDKKTKDVLVLEENKKNHSRSEEFDAQVRRSADWHSRAVRKIMVADANGKNKLLVQRLRDDGQYDTLSSNEVGSDLGEEPPKKI